MKKDHATRQSRVSLAAYGRSRFPEHIMYDLYLQILENKHPKVVRLPDGEDCGQYNCTCGLRVEGYSGAQDPTLDQKMLAMARMADRNWGQPGQHLHIENEIKAEVTAIGAGLDPRFFKGLTPKALKAIRDALTNRATPELPEGEPIPDVEFEELPK